MANSRAWVLLLLLILLGLFSSQFPAGAKAASTPAGITVSPAFQQVSIQSNQASQPVNFSITNNKSVAQNITLSSADFNTLSETGGLLFVGANPTQLQKKYGLAQWLQLTLKTVTLQPDQTVKLTANILNLPNLSPGGHYGALMISLGDGTRQKESGSVALQPIASSLLFVTKVGGDTHMLSLNDVKVSHSLLRLPSNVTLRFHNEGNTHLIPRGSVTLYDAKHRLISKGIINEDSGIILPETYRRYSVDLKRVTFPRLPGKYTLNVDYRFDGFDQYRRYSTSFFSVPRLVSAIEILALAAIVAGAAFYGYKSVRQNKK